MMNFTEQENNEFREILADMKECARIAAIERNAKKAERHAEIASASEYEIEIFYHADSALEIRHELFSVASLDLAMSLYAEYRKIGFDLGITKVNLYADDSKFKTCEFTYKNR